MHHPHKRQKRGHRQPVEVRVSHFESEEPPIPTQTARFASVHLGTRGRLSIHTSQATRLMDEAEVVDLSNILADDDDNERGGSTSETAFDTFFSEDELISGSGMQNMGGEDTEGEDEGDNARDDDVPSASTTVSHFNHEHSSSLLAYWKTPGQACTGLDTPQKAVFRRVYPSRRLRRY